MHPKNNFIVFVLYSAFALCLLQPTPAYSFLSDPLSVDLPDIEVIPGATWHWVGRQMSFNGMPMSVKMFEYAGEQSDVESFYAALWKKKGHGKIESKNYGLNRIMGFEHRGFYVSVQFLQEGFWTKGKIVVSESPGKRRKDLKTEMKTPPGSIVASIVGSLDAGKRAETVTIDSYKSVDFNARFYESQLDYDDWVLIYSNRGSSDSALMHYQRGGEQLQITIQKITGFDKNRSQILIHWIK